ncbi:IS30 family transposase [Brachybacterium sp. AOP29-B2-41]|uniref:IS30 family transposase n=1 Tax=Brachybacterium sp. AOP29-B2-41 TaxID=3457704 RepID=UPI004033CF38
MTVTRMVTETGGIRPERPRDPDRFLSLEERFRIKELLVERNSFRAIAKALGRNVTTISREVARGSEDGTRGRYRPTRGQRVAWGHRRRPKPLKIPSDPVLLDEVQKGLDAKLSPEQIVGRLRREHPGDPRFAVSHETIYKTIYLQARGGLKRDLAALTRTGRTIRRPHRQGPERRGRIRGMVSIWDRPAEALDRSIPGHWEGDLIIGKDGKSAIGTVVERHSNYLFLVHMDPSMNRVEALEAGLAAKLAELPATLKRTLTWDQGTEMHRHQSIAEMTGINIYFADPHSPWQRATNENTNGLLRQYFPKGTDLTIHSQMDLDLVADEMNRRPRRRLEFATPYEVLSEHLLQ